MSLVIPISEFATANIYTKFGSASEAAISELFPKGRARLEFEVRELPLQTALQEAPHVRRFTVQEVLGDKQGVSLVVFVELYAVPGLVAQPRAKLAFTEG